MRISNRWKQSKCLKWLRPVKRWFVPSSPPPPPILLPPSLAGHVEALPPMGRIPLSHRAALFETIGSRDLIDQMTRADIRLRARQIQQHLRCFPGESNGSACNGQAADGSWDSHDALTWYAWRFRPSVYVEIGTEIGHSAALVGLNSPETALVCFELGRDYERIPCRFFPAIVWQNLSGGGHSGPVTFFPGNSHEKLLSFSSRRSWRCLPSKLRTGDIELIYVNGRSGAGGIDRDAKEAFTACALGGLVVISVPHLADFWGRLQNHFYGFRYLTSPAGEVGLAFRLR